MPRLISPKPRLIATHCSLPLERLLLGVATFLLIDFEKRALITVVEKPQLSPCLLAQLLLCRRGIFHSKIHILYERTFMPLSEGRLWIYFFRIFVSKILRDLRWRIKLYKCNILWINKQLRNAGKFFSRNCANKFFHSLGKLRKLRNKIEVNVWWTVKSTPTASSFHLFSGNVREALPCNFTKWSANKRQEETTRNYQSYVARFEMKQLSLELFSNE